jgi:spore coat polysaccharide biosynthesis predicted glycosyltransferase SpsG
MRCSSLATAFEKKGYNCLFLCNHESESFFSKANLQYQLSDTFDKNDIESIRKIDPALVVFDSYLADEKYLKELSERVPLVMFDDNNDIYGAIPARVLINGNLFANDLYYTSLKGDTSFLLGPKYLVMRPEYWNVSNNISEKNTNTIMITTGGADFFDISVMLAEYLNEIKLQKQLIIGPSYTTEQIKKLEAIAREDECLTLIYQPSSLKKYIGNSSIVITAAGSTVYEVLTLKKTPIIYWFAENQKNITTYLQKLGFYNLGWYKQITKDSLMKGLKCAKKGITKEMSSLYNLLDGQGAKRVVNFIIDKVI